MTDKRKILISGMGCLLAAYVDATVLRYEELFFI